MSTFDLSFVGPHMEWWDIILTILMWGAVLLVLVALSIIVRSIRTILWIGVAALGVGVGIWLAETFNVGAIIAAVVMQPYYLAQSCGDRGIVGFVGTLVGLWACACLNAIVVGGPVLLLTRDKRLTKGYGRLGMIVAGLLFVIGLCA